LLEGFNFAQRDLFSASDPYMRITCGNDKFDERDNYQIDEPNPKFFKVYDFNVGFPGSPVVVIEAYDYDAFFGDDLIGTSKLDLDDRFFNKEWCAIENKPIEFRDLFHPTSTITQGVIKCWVEIFSMANKSSSAPALDITPEPIKEYEMRFIIWKTKEIEMMDFEGTSDVYCRTFLDDKEDHYTDTHWRNQNGKASFNWRNLIKIKSKQDEYKLTIQTYDKDIFASDEIIGEFSLDVQPIFEDAILTEKL
jgi:Ca2+-dependent lipid-binding protein